MTDQRESLQFCLSCALQSVNLLAAHISDFFPESIPTVNVCKQDIF